MIVLAFTGVANPITAFVRSGFPGLMPSTKLMFERIFSRN